MSAVQQALLIAGAVSQSLQPTFANVQLLLHANGSDGSTTVTDSSGAARAVTVNGNAQISTAQSKWGGSSLLFDGSGDYLSIADDASLEPGSGDFAIEAWVRTTTVAAGTATIFGKRANSASRGPFYVRRSAAALQLYATTVTGSWDLSVSGGTLVANTWHWVSLAKIGTTLRLYLDGNLVASGTVSGTLLNNSSALQIGGDTDANSWSGHIDDVRYVVGESHVTPANHATPSAQFPDA